MQKKNLPKINTNYLLEELWFASVEKVYIWYVCNTNISNETAKRSLEVINLQRIISYICSSSSIMKFYVAWVLAHYLAIWLALSALMASFKKSISKSSSNTPLYIKYLVAQTRCFCQEVVENKNRPKKDYILVLHLPGGQKHDSKRFVMLLYECWICANKFATQA